MFPLCGWDRQVDRVHPLFLSLAILNFKHDSLLVLSFVNSTQLPDLIAVFIERREQVPFSMARKCSNYAQVFSQTLAHGNRNNEIRLRNRERRL